MTDMTDEAVKALLDEMTFAMFGDGTDDTISEKLARALLDARAEHAASLIRINAEAVEAVAQARADAQAAVALVVSELRQFVTDSYQCACMDAGCAGRHAERNSTLEALSETLDALAPADGLAAVEALRVEARENAMQALASMGQAQEAYEAQLEAEAELAAAKQREAGLRAGHESIIANFGDIPGGHMAAVISRAALAQTPTDPGDGWTWNERLGWIGPDGKPADPRRG